MPDKFHKMEIVDVPSLASEVTERWVDIALTKVDGCDVRLAVINGEYPHMHVHEASEFFFVLEGQVLIDMDRDGVTETLKLGCHQGYAVPAGTKHRSRAPERAVLLMVEKAGASPGGV